MLNQQDESIEIAIKATKDQLNASLQRLLARKPSTGVVRGDKPMFELKQAT